MGLGVKMGRVKKYRTLKELYEVTAQVEQPKSTPVLEGSCTFRGPVDETEGHDQMDMGLSSTEGQLGRRFSSGKCNETEETGACGMCASPCSCYMNISRVASPVGTKDGIKDEVFAGKDASRCFFDDANMFSHSKSGPISDKHHTGSEISNPLSSCSSQNSFSENAYSKPIPRGSDISEVIGMPLKANSGQEIAGNCDFSKSLGFHGNSAALNQHKKEKELELLGDDVSCVSGADVTDVMLDDHGADDSRKNLSSSSSSVNSFPVDVKDVLQYISNRLTGSHSDEVEVNCHGRPIGFTEGSSEGFADVSKKLEVPQSSSLDTFHPGASSPKVEPLECSEEQSESTLTRGTSVGAGGQMNAVLRHSKSLEPVAEIENRVSSAEAVDCSDQKVQIGNSSPMLEEPKTQESVLPSQPEINMNRLIDQEIDVRVCDICGDEGQRHRLAICSTCSDGAEHIYCMRMKLDKVPEGCWMCEVCTLKDDKENRNEAKFDKAPRISRKLSLNKTGHDCKGSNLKVNSPLPLDVKHSAVGKGETGKTGSQCFAKRPGINLEGGSVKKRRVQETTIGSSGMSGPCQATALHQDSSYKSLDKEKIKITSKQISLDDYSSRISKSIRGTLRCHNSSLKNLDKGEAKNACGITSLDDHTLNKNSGKTFLHKSHTIISKPQNSKGHLYKSKSFNGVDSKVGVQLPVQGVAHRQKIAKHAAMGDSKNAGNSRMLHKSKSFNNASSKCFDVRHTKFKMLSPNVPCSDDVKRLRHAKEVGSCHSGHTSKVNESPAILQGSGISPLTSDRKLASNGASISLHTSGNNSRDVRASNCHGDSNGSLDRRSILRNTGTKYSNKGEDLVADDARKNAEHAEAAVHAVTTNKTNPNFPSRKRLQKVLPKIALDVAVPDKGAVPELDYVWRGGFELEGSGRLASSYDGIQAHLSTCASPKVLEVVDKLPRKIMLEEVPRLSTWPAQFLLNPVTENNIALYFFAKDIESYGRNYRSLLESMTENDLALKGNVDGVELLIFSSSLLPQESQRWNSLLFLWGLFRVRRLEHMPNAPVKKSVPCSVPMPKSEKMSTPKSDRIPASQHRTSTPSPNLFSPENSVLNLQQKPERKSCTPNSEYKLDSWEKMSVPSPNSAAPNKLHIPAISGCLDSSSSSQLVDSLSSSCATCNAQELSNSLPLAPASSGSVPNICEPKVTTTEQKILGAPAICSQQPSVDNSVQSEQSSGDVLHFKTVPKDTKRRLEIDLNSCCEEQTIDSAAGVYEEQEPKRTKNCFNAMSECCRGSKDSADGAMFRTKCTSPANPMDKIEPAMPNLELSLCGATERSAIDLELSLGAAELLLGGGENKSPPGAPYQVLPKDHKSVPLCLFGRCLNV